MIPLRLASLSVLALSVLLDARASRPINLPITQVEPTAGYRAEAVDRLRAAAGTIPLSSPEFNRLLKDVGATIIRDPAAAGSAAAPAAGAGVSRTGR
jgi:NTE family protein